MRMLYGKGIRFTAGLLSLAALLSLEACRDVQTPLAPETGSTANARLSANFMFYVLTDNNQILKLNTQNPSTPLETITLTGIPSGERLAGIDFRPATGQLYGVSKASRLYMINLMNGVATPLGTGPFTPAVNGDMIGFDFNPTVDRIRLITSGGQNLRLNPETGTTAAIDGAINGVPMVALSGAAYTNNRSGVTTTTLYDIDPITDKLYRQDPPNNGTLVEVGPLGVNIAGLGSFDIAPDGTAIATLIAGVTQGLYQINLSTGMAERLGNLPVNSIVGLAIPTDPVAYTADGMNMLHIFNPQTGVVTASKQITGLQSGETLYGLDFRPANGQLYAIGSTSRIYTINPSSGAAAAVGTGPFSPALEGTDVGFDFNPTVDRIRVVTNSGQNLRLNPDNGTVAAIDGRLNPGSPVVTSVAYTNNFAGATTTTLYDIDTRSTMPMLFRQNPPNNGGLELIGNVGMPLEGGNGFDIGGATGMGYGLFRWNGETKVYSVNLMTGAASNGVTLTGNPSVRGMAVGLGF
ncbi:DUF4394 domain-containing protein [Spirosoma sp. KUDC1026]|uniref:DUF4394 domain-containing protein n=1 Tax=Spirosoma sp. KUDC1026 TaxID=2745947 RepID=UPI00293C0F40|nr:DUF4394 domain-containing protein [Spirosoma sp. KUDC1026]